MVYFKSVYGKYTITPYRSYVQCSVCWKTLSRRSWRPLEHKAYSDSPTISVPSEYLDVDCRTSTNNHSRTTRARFPNNQSQQSVTCYVGSSSSGFTCIVPDWQSTTLECLYQLPVQAALWNGTRVQSNNGTYHSLAIQIRESWLTRLTEWYCLFFIRKPPTQMGLCPWLLQLSTPGNTAHQDQACDTDARGTLQYRKQLHQPFAIYLDHAEFSSSILSPLKLRCGDWIATTPS